MLRLYSFISLVFSSFSYFVYYENKYPTNYIWTSNPKVQMSIKKAALICTFVFGTISALFILLYLANLTINKN